MRPADYKLPGWMRALNCDFIQRDQILYAMREGDTLLVSNPEQGWHVWYSCETGMMHHVANARAIDPTPRGCVYCTAARNWSSSTEYLLLRDEHAARVMMLVEHRQHLALKILVERYIEENING